MLQVVLEAVGLPAGLPSAVCQGRSWVAAPGPKRSKVGGVIVPGTAAATDSLRPPELSAVQVAALPIYIPVNLRLPLPQAECLNQTVCCILMQASLF